MTNQDRALAIMASGVSIEARLKNIRHEIDLIESALSDAPAILSGGTQEPPKDPPK